MVKQHFDDAPGHSRLLASYARYELGDKGSSVDEAVREQACFSANAGRAKKNLKRRP